jgi:hypothetical protein
MTILWQLHFRSILFSAQGNGLSDVLSKAWRIFRSLPQAESPEVSSLAHKLTAFSSLRANVKKLGAIFGLKAGHHLTVSVV